MAILKVQLISNTSKWYLHIKINFAFIRDGKKNGWLNQWMRPKAWGYLRGDAGHFRDRA